MNPITIRKDQHWCVRAVLGVWVLALMTGCAPADDNVEIRASDVRTINSYFHLTTGWKVMPGDDDAWRLPSFDDSEWPEIWNTTSERALPEGWKGIGWYRNRIEVAEDLRGRTVAFYIHHPGASELYLNGQFIGGFGVVGKTPDTESRFHAASVRPMIATLSGDEVQTIAVRYSNHARHGVSRYGEYYGVHVTVAGYDSAADVEVHRARVIAQRKGLFTGLPAMIALIHLLLFVFYPAARQNFYYAMLCATFAWLNYVVWDMQFITGEIETQRAALIIKLLTVVGSLTSLRFIYSIFIKRSRASSGRLSALG